MRPLSYSRVSTVEEAVARATHEPAAAFLAGGTTEVDLIRAGVAMPDHLVDINDLPLAGVHDLPDGGVRIGALARMNDVARTPAVRERYPAISRALLLGASEQLRNMASMGGNLRQRTRCAYLRDGISPCNKRIPGSGCSALEGFNRGHAILGTSEHCVATHPSDVAVALAAFDAVIRTAGAEGERSIPFDDFFLLPGMTPEREHPLQHPDLIVHETLGLVCVRRERERTTVLRMNRQDLLGDPDHRIGSQLLEVVDIRDAHPPEYGPRIGIDRLPRFRECAGEIPRPR